MSETEIDNLAPRLDTTQTANVLIVGLDTEPTRLILEVLARKGLQGTVANDKNTAIAFLERDTIDMVFVSDKISIPDQSCPQLKYSFELLEKIRANSPELPVIMIAKTQNREIENPNQTVETAVKAIRAGCYDFVFEPLKIGKIEIWLSIFLPNHKVSSFSSGDNTHQNNCMIVGRSAKLAQTIELARRIAPTSCPALISGESGTGKELIAHLIHQESKRSQCPYIKVNCAALSDSLLESELFGHEKGAFTGALTQRKGRFEMAHGGTLLLDEIAETPIEFQAKLLRVIEQQDFERVGGNENVRVNVRIISTTNRDLLQEIRQGRFRQDLYYRLSGIRLIVAPLRERSEDLTDLVWHFVNLYARQAQRRISRLDSVMIDMFAKYHWPGNVRQLRNVVLTSLILGTGETLSLADVSWLFDELQPLPQKKESDLAVSHNNDRNSDTSRFSDLAGVSLEHIEQQAILDTLRQTSGNQIKAAKSLGISDRTLRDKIRRYRQEGCLSR